MTHESLIPWDEDDAFAATPGAAAVEDEPPAVDDEEAVASPWRGKLESDPPPAEPDTAEAELWSDAVRSAAAAGAVPAPDRVLGTRDADELARERLADSVEPRPELGRRLAAGELEDPAIRTIGTASPTGEDDYLFG